MISAISVKDRLKKQAMEDGKTMQDKLVTYGLDGTELKNAIVETFTHRGTGFDDIAAFEDDFTEDVTRQGRWNFQ